MFGGSGASHQICATEKIINTVVAMARTMLMHDTIKFTERTFSTDIYPMTMGYAVWFYNPVPDIQSSISGIDIWLTSRFIQFQKLCVTGIFGVVCHTFWNQSFRVMERKILSGILGVK